MCASPSIVTELGVARKAADYATALSALSDEHRQVLLLRYMQEMDYGEIAVALDISEGTVKSRINRAKARLKELLSGGGNLSAVISVKSAGEEGQK